MTLFKLIRDYIAAMRAQTEATMAATAAANRALHDAAWERYRAARAHSHSHGHGHRHGHHGHAGGNASMPGGCS